jgi:hypothetical protein
VADDEPPESTGQNLHEELLGGDDSAPARIAEAFLPWLRRKMKSLHHEVRDGHLRNTACIDALRSYFKNPAGFRPDQLSLGKYLLMSAKGDLLNALDQRKAGRARDEEIAKKLVELPPPTAEQPSKAELLKETVRPLLVDPMDQRLFSLMVEGVRDTGAYSVILGIHDRSEDEQRRIVKLRKDRIIKKLKDARKRGKLKLPQLEELDL